MTVYDIIGIIGMIAVAIMFAQSLKSSTPNPKEYLK
jgi:hypothetical protein